MSAEAADVVEDTEPVGGDNVRAKLEAGATLRSHSGLAIRAQGAYDGIGDDKFNSWQGRATIVVPF